MLVDVVVFRDYCNDVRWEFCYLSERRGVGEGYEWRLYGCLCFVYKYIWIKVKCFY